MAVLIIMIILAILLIGVRILGFTPYSVLSPSMTPKYPVGSLIYVKDIDTNDIVVGDDITFVLDESLTVVTHQVVEIDENHQFFTTQGIANDTPDGNPVYYANIIGKPHFCIPLLGHISDKVTSTEGIIITIIVVLMWIIIICILEMIKKEKEKRAKFAK